MISGNDSSGIAILSSTAPGATGNVVLGNLIGTNLAGSAALANLGSDIAITNSAVNTIGGTQLAPERPSRATTAAALRSSPPSHPGRRAMSSWST